MDEGEDEEAADAVHKPERMYIYIFFVEMLPEFRYFSKNFRGKICLIAKHIFIMNFA